MTFSNVYSVYQFTIRFLLLSHSDMNAPFSQWTKQQVCDWLEDYGLGQYVNLTRQWVENGQTLLSSTVQDFEKVRIIQNHCSALQ